MLITEGYKKLNEQLHKENEAYGVSGQKYAEMVMMIATGMGVTKILDYGCGKCTLSNALPQFEWQLYDPCISQFDIDPTPHDLVVCTDVLEHIEPDCVNDVLDHLTSLSQKTLFVQVATRLARKTLADGTNTHKSVHHPLWWLDKFLGYGMECVNMQQDIGNGFTAALVRVSK